jgi:hypothetical protein
VEIRIGRKPAVNFDLDALQKKAEDPAAYGSGLTQSLFSEKELLSAFSKARAIAQNAKIPLRVRLVIGPTASELNSLYWESMLDPENDKATLFTGEQVYLSRYLSSLDWRPIKLRSKGNLKSLVAVANPSGLGEYELGEVDVAGELGRAKASLDGIPITALPAQAGEHCTLDAIIEHLRQGYDILYLVAHGSFVKEEPWLWLEDEKGRITWVRVQWLPGSRLETSALDHLASCQRRRLRRQALAWVPSWPKSARRRGDAGSVSMDTIAKFAGVLHELQKDGRIDRAMSVARGAVRGQSDFWMPVLFMRLRSGRIWYVPGFGEEGGDFKKWPALLASVQTGTCTPILGSGLHERLYGTSRDLAMGLADKYHYPLSPSLGCTTAGDAIFRSTGTNTAVRSTR